MVFQGMFTRGGAKIPRLFMGCAEAEAEAQNQRMPLVDVYEDHHDIAAQLDNEKFILIGRKGSGKSAFGTYVCEHCKNHPTAFSKFIRKHDYDLELITRGAKEASVEFNAASFIKWLVLTQVIKLFLESEAAKDGKKFNLLEQFLRKNSGYVEINRSLVVEEIKRHQFKVSTEFFKRFIAGEKVKSLDVKEDRAHFTRLLPHLEEVVRSILLSPIVLRNENSFTLFFDDLDLDYLGSETSKSALVELLRTVKSLNLDTFAGTGAKVIVLLRDDIESELSGFADTGKMLSSYSHRISWVRERELKKSEEKDIRLKRMIDRRIRKACEVAGVPCRQDDPWETLVSFRPEQSSKTTFREILEFTLFRPRDLIVFFAPLNDNDYSLPLDFGDVRKLKDAYARALVGELKNEMIARYTQVEVDGIFRALPKLRQGTNYSDLLSALREDVPTCDAELLAAYLYDRSVIGNIDERGLYWFACRSVPGSRGSGINTEFSFVVQIALRRHFSEVSGQK